MSDYICVLHDSVACDMCVKQMQALESERDRLKHDLELSHGELRLQEAEIDRLKAEVGAMNRHLAMLEKASDAWKAKAEGWEADALRYAKNTDYWKDKYHVECKKVGEFIREGTALQEFEDRQKKQIEMLKAKAEKLEGALKEISEDREFTYTVSGKFVRPTWYINRAKAALEEASKP